ncbi:MAG TPA: hypothetical protein VH540_01125 [Ktedonobacterales bacterium]|jgi:hypothetical protein
MVLDVGADCVQFPALQYAEAQASEELIEIISAHLMTRSEPTMMPTLDAADHISG